MELTGKTKELFDDWMFKVHWKNIRRNEPTEIKEKLDRLDLKFFNGKPVSEKYGVYVDFFDDLSKREDMICRICILIIETQQGFAYTINGSISDTYVDRNEARIKAIEKANKILN